MRFNTESLLYHITALANAELYNENLGCCSIGERLRVQEFADLPVAVLHFVLKIENEGAVKMAMCTHVQVVVAP